VKSIPRGGLVIVAIAARLFFENAWHFKNIFREFEDFLKISILFEDIFRETEASFLINVKDFQKLRLFWGFFVTFKEKWRFFQ
jgi:hypothetical protein